MTWGALIILDDKWRYNEQCYNEFFPEITGIEYYVLSFQVASLVLFWNSKNSDWFWFMNVYANSKW